MLSSDFLSRLYIIYFTCFINNLFNINLMNFKIRNLIKQMDSANLFIHSNFKYFIPVNFSEIFICILLRFIDYIPIYIH